MCSGAMQRNKAPYWVHRTWVNVRLEHMQQETEKKRGGGAQRRGEKRLREAEVGGDEMESKSGIIYNGLRALLRHFIQHLVKRGLFCFACVVSNARRSQFVGSFVKRWTASPASQRCHGAEKSSLAPECRWESGCWRLPAYRLKCGLENNGN